MSEQHPPDLAPDLAASRHLSDVEATRDLGSELAQRLGPGQTVWLRGDLGAGKTSLAAAILRGLGENGPVKSPTFTLVEPHPLDNFVVYHFDLYRLSDPEELEFLGGRDYFGGNCLCLVEWPERGEGWLPAPDLVVELAVEGHGRRATLRWGADARRDGSGET